MPADDLPRTRSTTGLYPEGGWITQPRVAARTLGGPARPPGFTPKGVGSHSPGSRRAPWGDRPDHRALPRRGLDHTAQGRGAHPGWTGPTTGLYPEEDWITQPRVAARTLGGPARPPGFTPKRVGSHSPGSRRTLGGPARPPGFTPKRVGSHS